jgi:hypothetical protein
MNKTIRFKKRQSPIHDWQQVHKNGCMIFADMTFAPRNLPRDIYPYNICPEGQLPRRHLPRKTFSQNRSFRLSVRTLIFTQKHICLKGHLPRKTFTQKNVCPEHVCPEPEGHLPRKAFDQKDICPKDICPERHLPRKTIAQMRFDQKDI